MSRLKPVWNQENTYELQKLMGQLELLIAGLGTSALSSPKDFGISTITTVPFPLQEAYEIVRQILHEVTGYGSSTSKKGSPTHSDLLQQAVSLLDDAMFELQNQQKKGGGKGAEGSSILYGVIDLTQSATARAELITLNLQEKERKEEWLEAIIEKSKEEVAVQQRLDLEDSSFALGCRLHAYGELTAYTFIQRNRPEDQKRSKTLGEQLSKLGEKLTSVNAKKSTLHDIRTIHAILSDCQKTLNEIDLLKGERRQGLLFEGLGFLSQDLHQGIEGVLQILRTV